jgi:hypothetical protein
MGMSEDRRFMADESRGWEYRVRDEFTPEDEVAFAAFKQGLREAAEEVVRKSAADKRAKRLLTMKRWRADHQDQMRESMRKWRLANKGKTKAYGAAYYDEKKASILKQRRDRYADHKLKAKKAAALEAAS